MYTPRQHLSQCPTKHAASAPHRGAPQFQLRRPVPSPACGTEQVPAPERRAEPYAPAAALLYTGASQAVADSIAAGLYVAPNTGSAQAQARAAAILQQSTGVVSLLLDSAHACTGCTIRWERPKALPTRALARNPSHAIAA